MASNGESVGASSEDKGVLLSEVGKDTGWKNQQSPTRNEPSEIYFDLTPEKPIG